MLLFDLKMASALTKEPLKQHWDAAIISGLAAALSSSWLILGTARTSWATVERRMKWMWRFKTSCRLARRLSWNESDATCRSLTKHRSRWWRRRPSETLVTSSGRGEDLCLLFGSNRSRICLWSCQSLNREYSKSHVAFKVQTSW